MSAKTVFEIRLELAQGHWDIGEYDDALRCLERALESASVPLDPRLADLAWSLANGLTHYVGNDASDGLRDRLTQVAEAATPAEESLPEEPAQPAQPAASQWAEPTDSDWPESAAADWADPAPLEPADPAEPRSNIATPTLAELLASQGYHDQALRVADKALARNPLDPRARTVRESLEERALKAEAEAKAAEPEPVSHPWPDPRDAEPLRVDSHRLDSLGLETPELPNPEPLGRRDDTRPRQVIAELERWLQNLERDRSLRQAEGSVRA